MDGYQVKGKGLISASMSSWKLNFCGTFQAGRAGEMKAREDYSPTPEPSLPGLPLAEGNPPFPGPSQAGTQAVILDQRSQLGLCSDGPMSHNAAPP